MHVPNVVRLVSIALCIYMMIGCLVADIPDPIRYRQFLQNNIYRPGCPEVPTLPLSYFIHPPDYFEKVPLEERTPPDQVITEPKIVPICHNKLVPPELLNAYTFQSEKFLNLLGLNIYDGSVWTVALNLLGEHAIPKQYEDTVLARGATCQFANIMADATCNGIVNEGQCSDPEEIGACGFCYGDGIDRTLKPPHAWFFRMISNIWAVQGTLDARCPELNVVWIWNDYKPVLGENAWTRLTGILQSAYLRAGKDINGITDQDLAIPLNYILSLEKMMIPEIGAIYYAPHNTWSFDGLAGNQISTENQASTLSGLKILEHVLVTKQVHLDYLPRVRSLSDMIERYLLASYYSEGYFRQGGVFNSTTRSFTWATEPFFAVDCQTWVLSVLGPNKIDSWHGANTALLVWQKTKEIGGYGYNAVTGTVKGVGFSDNTQAQVFSGEWTFGAINMVRVLANYYTDQDVKNKLTLEATTMRNAIEAELIATQDINGVSSTGVLYANKRYYIPFGWWANPLLATSSTGWSVMIDKNYNPFYLGGSYAVYQ